MRAARSRRAQSLVALVGAAAIAGCLVAAAQAGRSEQRFVIYSVAKQEQYVNNADDRTRGRGNNPFGNYKDTAPTVKSAAPPFPGDEAIFAFTLYGDGTLKKRVGSAVFMCYYNFSKNAYCDAAFHLGNGTTLMASGAFNFSAPKFTLAVTGGYGRYAGASGVVDERPAARHAQRLVFRLR